MEDSIVITLRKPVMLGSQEYATLSLEEPDAEQLVTAEQAGSPLAQLVMLIHLNAKVPKAVAMKLKQRDLEACGDFFGRFSGGSQSDSNPSGTLSPN